MFGDRTEEYDRGKRKQDQHRRPLERGFVTSVAELASGVEPYVELEPHQSPRTTARVPQPTRGDRRLPAEGDEVYFTRRGDDVAVILGIVATDHDGYATERRIDHRHSDAHITIDADGRITAVAADGTSITVDGGTLQVNDGATPVVTDIETSTDGDGHVTSVTPVTNDSLQL